MKIAVASGKGGTGKSTIAANLAFSLSKKMDVTLADCDVEEPDLHLFFKGVSSANNVTVPIPQILEDRCSRCGICGEFCRYGALLVLADRVKVFEHLCHSCGGCSIICPARAIEEVPRIIGKVTRQTPVPGLILVSGVLNEGEIAGSAIIKQLKNYTREDPVVIYDSSPGTSCPVVETLRGCDICILVTESSPFGLHDIKLAAEVAGLMEVPAAVIINRSDGQDKEMREWCMDRNLPVLLTIPVDRKITALQNEGELFSAVLTEWQEIFITLYQSIRNIMRGFG